MKNQPTNNPKLPLSWEKMRKILQIFTLIALSFLVLYSCSKKEEGCTDEAALNFDPKAIEDDGSCTYCYEPTNPQCTNYDPCYAAAPVTAQFDALERLGVTADADTFIITTNKFMQTSVKFEAHEENANYTWHIGTETLHTRSFVRSFANHQLLGQTIPVTLVVEKTPDLTCNPNDDGKDSVTRYFEVIDKCSTLLFDTFVGVWESQPLDVFEIAIIHLPDPDPWATGCNYDIRFWNFNKQGAELQGDSESFTYHYVRIWEAIPSTFGIDFRIRRLNSSGNSINNSLVGFVHADQKTVEFNYRIEYDIGGFQDHRFIGKKKH